MPKNPKNPKKTSRTIIEKHPITPKTPPSVQENTGASKDWLILSLILRRSAPNRDLAIFEELKTYHGITIPNTEIMRRALRTEHKKIFG